MSLIDEVYDIMNQKDPNYKLAIEKATQGANQKDDDEWEYRKLIGKALLDQYYKNSQKQMDLKLSENAIQEFQASLRLMKDQNEETLLLLADAEFLLGRYEEAKAHYKELNQILSDPNYEAPLTPDGQQIESSDTNISNCYKGIAECELRLNNIEDAMRQFQNALDRQQKFPKEKLDLEQIYYQRANYLYTIHDYQGAQADIFNALKHGKQKSKLYAFQVKIFEAQNKYDEAEKAFDIFPKEIQKDPIILDAKGKVYLHQLKYDKAEEVFKSFQGVEAQLGLAQTYLKQKKYNLAIEQYEKILKEQQNHIGALNNLGICHLENQRLDQAREMFEKICKFNPNDAVALSNLSDIEFKLAQQNKDGKQEAHLKEAIRLCELVIKSPNSFEQAVAFNRLGACYQIQKKFKEAEDAFIKSIAAEPKFVLAWANQAQVQLMLNKPAESLASLKRSEELLKDNFSKRTLSDANINFIQAGLKKILTLQEDFGKVADEIKAKMDVMLKRPNVLANHKNITQEYEELEKQRYEILKKQYDKIQSNENKGSEDDKEYQKLQQQMQALQQRLDNQYKELDEIEKKQQQQANRTSALEQRVDKMRETLRASGVYDQVKIKVWMNENRHSEEGKYAKAFYWTLLNYIDSYRVASTGILQTNVEHAEIDNKVSNGVKLAKKALEVGSSLCESLPLVGSIFKVIDGAIDYCYSEYKQKKFEDKVNSINKIIMENHSANTQEDLSQIITKAAIEIAKKKGEAKVFIQLQFELENPKPPGTIDKITGFFTAKINQIREYALGKQIELYDSVGGGEALKDVIMCLAHLQKNFEDVIKKSETILLDVQIEQIVTDKIQTLLKDVKQVPTSLEPIKEDDWEVPQQSPQQIKEPVEQQNLQQKQSPPQQTQQQQQTQQNNPQLQQEQENVQVQKQSKPIEVNNQDKQEIKQTEQSRDSSCCIIQ